MNSRAAITYDEHYRGQFGRYVRDRRLAGSLPLAMFEALPRIENSDLHEARCRGMRPRLGKMLRQFAIASGNDRGEQFVLVREVPICGPVRDPGCLGKRT